MLTKLRQTIGQGVMVVADVAGLILSSSGAAVALFLGKLFAAAILCAISLGIFLRIAGRRGTQTGLPPPTPPWVSLSSAFLAILEVGALAEATNLPVRVNQPGFEKYNWVLVVVALFVLYLIQVRFFRMLISRRDANDQKSEP